MPRIPNFGIEEGGFRCFILFGFVASVILFVITQWVDWGRYETGGEVLEKLAEALIIAMVLAFTVDRYLKKALTKDAVEAAIGYILPRYLQEEMAAIYSNEVVCIDHNQVVALIQMPDDLMRVRVRVERVLENISTAHHTFNPQIIVDEWLVADARSAIHECGYRKDGEQPIIAPVAETKPMVGNLPRLVLGLPPTTIAPKGRIHFWYDLEEIKRRSDVHALKFRYSTNSPRVRVDAPSDIDWRVEFAHRQDTKKERYSNVTVLPGLMLPHQCIFVWWWDKHREAKWNTTFTPPK